MRSQKRFENSDGESVSEWLSVSTKNTMWGHDGREKVQKPILLLDHTFKKRWVLFGKSVRIARQYSVYNLWFCGWFSVLLRSPDARGSVPAFRVWFIQLLNRIVRITLWILRTMLHCNWFYGTVADVIVAVIFVYVSLDLNNQCGLIENDVSFTSVHSTLIRLNYFRCSFFFFHLVWYKIHEIDVNGTCSSVCDTLQINRLVFFSRSPVYVPCCAQVCAIVRVIQSSDIDWSDLLVHLWFLQFFSFHLYLSFVISQFFSCSSTCSLTFSLERFLILDFDNLEYRIDYSSCSFDLESISICSSISSSHSYLMAMCWFFSLISLWVFTFV